MRLDWDAIFSRLGQSPHDADFHLMNCDRCGQQYLVDDEVLTLYLDPDLTLARLARRMTLPAKQVSAAVNRVTGENVSRLINGYRIRHACERLAAGDGVTTAMLASGFNTKSNFNREFLRVTGMSPSRWTSASPPGPRSEPVVRAQSGALPSLIRVSGPER